MKTIFFDLETTSLNFCGQILNCCFIEVDSNFEPIDKLKLDIRLKSYEIPEPQAIVANGVDIFKHLDSSLPTEAEAMIQISDWIQERTDFEHTVLIGKNSYRFDIPFLRTSMIRNGVNPYFGFNLVNKDLEHCITKLLVTDDKFRDKLSETSYGHLGVRSLESVCRNLGLLDGKQDHESESDVLLTISLAKHLLLKYGMDVRTYNAYEGSFMENIMEIFPNLTYVNKAGVGQFVAYTPFVCHEANNKYALFLDLDKYEKYTPDKDPRTCFKWINKADGSLFFDPTINLSHSGSHKTLLNQAIHDPMINSVNLRNFFDERDCDIEAFIYRLPFKHNDALKIYCQTFKMCDMSLFDHQDLKTLSRRFFMENYRPKTDQQIEAQNTFFSEYAEYRYGNGKNVMKVDRFDTTSKYRTLENADSYHRTLRDMIEHLNMMVDSGTTKSTLFRFYTEHPILKYLIEKGLY